MSVRFFQRIGLVLLAATGLSACASALPNGAAPVSSLYSFNDTARFMLGDICLPAVIDDVPVASRADVPAVYRVEDASMPTWRAGPGGAVRASQTGERACTVTATRGIAPDMREALIREVESSRVVFRMADSEPRPGMVTDLFCAADAPSYPSGLSVLMQTRMGEVPRDSVLVSAAVQVRRDLCL